MFASLSSNLQQQRARAASGVVGRGGCDGVVRPDAEHLGDDAADLCRGIELTLALATLGGEVPHKILVGVAEDIVVLGAVLCEVELRVVEDGNEVAKAVHARLAVAKLSGVVEVGKVAAGEAGVGVDQRLDDLGVDLVADVAVAGKRHHVVETRALRDNDGRLKAVVVRVFVGHVFDKQHEQDIVLVLAGIHAAA